MNSFFPLNDNRTLKYYLLSIALASWIGTGFAASPKWLTQHDAEIKQLVARMTLAEKAGQMTQPDLGALRNFDDIQTLALGSVLSGGTSDPKTGNHLSDWANLYTNCQSRALKSRLGIPILYGIDAVHGHNNVLGAVIFPHNIGLGCTRNAELIEQISYITAKEVRATGIQWSFAPCVAVPRDIRWGRTYEGYAEDPAMVTPLGVAAVRGLQGDDLTSPFAVAACAKHFIGDGGTTFEVKNGKVLIDQGDTRVDEATLRAIHLTGYPAAIDAGVGTIMPSFSSWNGVKCSASKYLLTDLLKKELGFEGFLISDYNAIDQIVPSKAKADAEASNNASGQVRSDNYKKCIEISINAGMDMVMVTKRYPQFIEQLMELVNEGKIPMERIDDAVTRILRVKFAMGLVPNSDALHIDPELQKSFGSAEHRAVARQAVQQSLVLLKNDTDTLPVSKSAKRIHVAGRSADDMGMQCGGWTIGWQGEMGPVTTGGTTILAAIQERAGKDIQVTTSLDGSGATGASLGVVVIGETPYAEGKGDRIDLGLANEDIAAVERMKSSGIPVVVVILSGRPLILGDIADKADAIVAAWLPGTEGAGIADVLFGDVAPTGKLSFTWPRSMDQIPLGHGQEPIRDALFPLGFGLTYSSAAN